MINDSLFSLPAADEGEMADNSTLQVVAAVPRRPLSHKPNHISAKATPAALHPSAHPGLSPIASVSSSTSYIPKSSSSTGPGHSPINYEIQTHPDKQHTIQSLADIDERLESINESVYLSS